MLDLTGHMIIWGGLFAHGDGSTGLISCLATSQAMELSEQPLAVKNVVQFGLYVA
jgi:hypothetical protein